MMQNAQAVLGNQPSTTLPLPEALATVGMCKWHQERRSTLMFTAVSALLPLDGAGQQATLRSYHYTQDVLLRFTRTTFLASPVAEGWLIGAGDKNKLAVTLNTVPVGNISLTSSSFTRPDGAPWGGFARDKGTHRVHFGGRPVGEIHYNDNVFALVDLPHDDPDRCRFSNLRGINIDEAAMMLALYFHHMMDQLIFDIRARRRMSPTKRRLVKR